MLRSGPACMLLKTEQYALSEEYKNKVNDCNNLKYSERQPL